jgi:hypothetical protein
MGDLLARVMKQMIWRCAGLLGPMRRDWAEALLAEADETPPGWARVTWFAGGLGLVAREAARQVGIRVLAFGAAAGGVLWIAWQGSSSDSAVPVNRAEVPVVLALLAILPLVVRRRFGPVRDGWLARTARVGCYAVVFALIAVRSEQTREGQKLGAYFYDLGIMRGFELLVMTAYAALILIMTSRGVRLSRSTLPITIGIGTGVVLVAFACTGLNLFQMQPRWWGLMTVAIPLTTGFAVRRFADRDRPATVMDAARQGGLGAICASGIAAMILVTLTTGTIALFPQRVPLQIPPPPSNGGCETCEPVNLVIPASLRHEYWVELSVDQAGGSDFVLFGVPLPSVILGGVGVGLAGVTRRRKGHGDERYAPLLSART